MRKCAVIALMLTTCCPHLADHSVVFLLLLAVCFSVLLFICYWAMYAVVVVAFVCAFFKICRVVFLLSLQLFSAIKAWNVLENWQNSHTKIKWEIWSVCKWHSLLWIMTEQGDYNCLQVDYRLLRRQLCNSCCVWCIIFVVQRLSSKEIWLVGCFCFCLNSAWWFEVPIM